MNRYNINYNFEFLDDLKNPVTVKISFASVGNDCDSAVADLESRMNSLDNLYQIVYKEQNHQLNFTSGSYLDCNSL